MRTAAWVIAVVLLGALAGYFVPLLAFWAIEVLFGFEVPRTPQSWVAAWLLIGIVGR